MSLRLPVLLLGILLTASQVAAQQISAPVLVSEPTSTRAIAFESPTFKAQPFSPSAGLNWNLDGRNRIVLFVLGLTLAPGEGLSSLRADAEDGLGHHYELAVEDYRKSVDRDWLGQIVLRISDNMGDVGDCLIKVSYSNIPSNRVRVAIGHFGGGPPDDAGAMPTPAPPGYSLSGSIRTSTGGGIANVTVRLTGSVTAQTVTNNAGQYSFSNLPGGYNYRIDVSDDNYFFTPGAQDIVSSLGNQTYDFTGTSAFRIRGFVTVSGAPVFGVKMSLSGRSIGTTTTAADGSYQFKILQGTYTVTPSFEQGFYSFSPLSRNVLLTSHHDGVDFAGAFSPISGPIKVLEFDGTPMNVDHGAFWPGFTNLGHFFWELWAMPRGDNNSTRYMLSDGYGGAHALLFGFAFTEIGHYSLFGNIWKGDGTAVAFSSVEGPAPNEWGHFAVGWDGNNVITYYDGVPVGKVPFTGPRQTLEEPSGSGHLFIGGSDHQNLIGRVAQARGYEDSNPRASAPESTFTPETFFSRQGSFLSYYLRPSPGIADLTLSGYRGIAHAGTLRGMTRGFYDPCLGCPVPQFVDDPTAPNFANPNNPGQIITTTGTPASPPPGTRVFDSFTRNNSTYILGGQGGLGTTESGSAGALTWQMSPQPAGRKPFGILNGRAVLLADTRAAAWIVTGNTNQEVSVNRGAAIWGSGTNTGIAFRVIDADALFFAYTSDDPQSGQQRLTVGYYVFGNRAVLTDSPFLPSSWSRLRVVTTLAGRIEVYADNSLLYSTDNPTLANVTGVGLYNNASGMALTNRWDNFTVVQVP